MPSPEQAQYVREYAYVETGHSVAAAIVCCAIFFVFSIIVVANWIYTRFSWYDFLLVSCLFRTVALATRAVYLAPGRYRPALQGVFLAFYNAGYGANTIAMAFVFSLAWMSNKQVILFPRPFEIFSKVFALFLVVCIITFGPICGAIAAFLEFGQYNHPSAALTGERIRFAASYGLLGSNLSLAVLLGIWSVRCLLSEEVKRRALGRPLWRRKEPRWVGVQCLCCILLLIRGSTGVSALYQRTADVWELDKKFYTLDTLVEYIVLCIVCFPTLYARFGCAWPKEEEAEAKNAKAENNGAV